MKERIMELCKELCCKEITEDEQLIITGLLDSFKIMELICSLEETFLITFRPEEMTELEHFSCVNHIVDIVENKKRIILGQNGCQ